MKKKWVFVCSPLILLVMLSGTLVFAKEPIPSRAQAVLLIKVVTFIKQLAEQAKSDVIIGVLDGNSIFVSLEEAAKKSGEKILVKKVSLDGIGGIHILLIPEGVDPGVIQQAKKDAIQSKVLTVGGDPQFVSDFNLSLSFYLKNGKPRILINQSSARDEGAKFQAKLLKIADLH